MFLSPSLGSRAVLDEKKQAVNGVFMCTSTKGCINLELSRSPVQLNSMKYLHNIKDKINTIERRDLSKSPKTKTKTKTKTETNKKKKKLWLVS